MREHINLIEASTRPAKLETTPLPYGENDLNPVLSGDSINYHYGHLAKGYAKRYNAGEGDADFNRAGSFLHNKFFPQLQPPKGNNRPRGAVLELIERKFKSYENFQDEVKKTAMKIQGSVTLQLLCRTAFPGRRKQRKCSRRPGKAVLPVCLTANLFNQQSLTRRVGINAD